MSVEQFTQQTKMKQFIKLNDGTLVNADIIARIGQDELVFLDGETVQLAPDERSRIADAVQKGGPLAVEVSHLTAAVRDLWQLLRARLR